MSTKREELPLDQVENCIAICSLSHKRADLDLRERLSVTESEFGQTLEEILSLPEISEAVILSTCNRVEIIVVVDLETTNQALGEQIIELFEKRSGLHKSFFAAKFELYRGREAIAHIFKVGAGIDSMVVGEPQILGQLKVSYEKAHHQGSVGSILHRLFQKTFRVAKDIRTNTDIGKNAVSLCYAAKELARQIVGDLSDAQLMLVGAGEMASLTLTHFRSAGIQSFFVANKTLPNAVRLATSVAGIPLELEVLERFLPQVDIIVGVSHIDSQSSYLLTESHVNQALTERQSRPQFYIDLGVPRNFSPEIETLSDAFLYNIDDLQQIVDQNMNQRIIEAERAATMISSEVSHFCSWLETRSVDPLIKELIKKGDSVKKQEISKTLKRLRQEGIPEKNLHLIAQALVDMADSLHGKMLHKPLTQLKTETKQGRDIEKLFQDLFLDKNGD